MLQDLLYWYDAAGNITFKRDEAQQTVYFNNGAAFPENDYTYDALYRLIKAGGREHAGQNAPVSWNDADKRGLPHTADEQKMQNYLQYYTYDAVGNMTEMRHTAGVGYYQNCWTRTFEIDGGSNRLVSTSGGGDDDSTFTHDARGNLITGFKHLSVSVSEQMAYNESNRLEKVALGDGRMAYYQYDGAGQRVRKTLTDAQGGSRTEERKYVGGVWEVYTRWDSGNSNTVSLRRETLHLMDDTNRVAMVETRTMGWDAEEPDQLIRYQYADHLGSASLEVDENGNIISYEEYYPYGSTSFQSGRSTAEVSIKRYRYTGKERDEETGLAYHGARYYAPWLGRWCAVDPINIEWYNYLQGISERNLERQAVELTASSYEYCYDNPIRFTDPTGEQVPPIIPIPSPIPFIPIIPVPNPSHPVVRKGIEALREVLKHFRPSPPLVPPTRTPRPVLPIPLPGQPGLPIPLPQPKQKDGRGNSNRRDENPNSNRKPVPTPGKPVLPLNEPSPQPNKPIDKIGPQTNEPDSKVAYRAMATLNGEWIQSPPQGAPNGNQLGVRTPETHKDPRFQDVKPVDGMVGDPYTPPDEGLSATIDKEEAIAMMNMKVKNEGAVGMVSFGQIRALGLNPTQDRGTHITIRPALAMTLTEFQKRLNNIPWQPTIKK